MQLVDVGQHAQLAHVDDLDDAGGDTRSPWREKICTTTPSSGERTSAVLDGARRCRRWHGIGEVDLVLRQVVRQGRLQQASLTFWRSSSARRVELELASDRAACRARPFEGLSLFSSIDDLSVASCRRSRRRGALQTDRRLLELSSRSASACAGHVGSG
jgi:hypothetical protein